MEIEMKLVLIAVAWACIGVTMVGLGRFRRHRKAEADIRRRLDWSTRHQALRYEGDEIIPPPL